MERHRNLGGRRARSPARTSVISIAGPPPSSAVKNRISCSRRWRVRGASTSAICRLRLLSKIAAIILATSFVAAKADDKFAAPDLSAWYASLMQPDNPTMSCCGWADAYEADEIAECGAIPNCAVVAIITDTRPDERKLPDGRTLVRSHREIGERIVIPPNKVRRH